MVLIAIDPHKTSHTACALGPSGDELGQLRVEARQREQLLRWAQQWPERRWAIEGAHGLGHGLAQWLVAHGEAVVDVPARLVARVRLLSGGGKSDPADARATGVAAQRAERLHPVVAEDDTVPLRLLTDRRDDLTAERTRTVNRLHRLLRDLLPGGGPRKLSADEASRLLRRLRPGSAADQVRLELAKELVTELRALDRKLLANEARIAAAVRAYGSTLTDLAGVGVIVAAKLIGRSGPMRRFPTAAQYAAYAGAAPLETSSGDVRRHRLNRRGDLQLNRALYTAALTQARMPQTDGYAYVVRKRQEGKSTKEALRCLKRRLANVVYRRLLADERARGLRAAA